MDHGWESMRTSYDKCLLDEPWFCKNSQPGPDSFMTIHDVQFRFGEFALIVFMLIVFGIFS